MPSSQTPVTPKASKRPRTESTRKREGRENAEAIQRDRNTKKAAAKARKVLRNEAADDNLLVECEGDSLDLQKLRVLTLRLEAENQRLKAKAKRHNDKAAAPATEIINEPGNKGEITIKRLREHLGWTGDEHDVEWSMLRHGFRGMLVAGGLDWTKTWPKQDLDKQNTMIHVAESRYPAMKRFANHWGAIFLLRECFGNIYSYQQKLAGLSKRSHPDDTNTTSDRDTQTDDENTDKVNKAWAHRAAAHRAAARHDARCRAEALVAGDSGTCGDSNANSFNDGETEPEDIPDDVRQTIERDEIGVPGNAKLVATTKAMLNLATPNTSKVGVPSKAHLKSVSKTRAMIFMRRGRGGKVNMSRSSQPIHGKAPAREEAEVSEDEEVVSDSSGQTSDGSEED